MNRRGFLIAASAPIVAVPASALADLGGVVSPFPGVSVCLAPETAPVADRVALLKSYFAFLVGEMHPVFDELATLGHPAGRLGINAEASRMRVHAETAPIPSTRASAVMAAAGVWP